jgi:hypothetical protein
MRMEVGINKVHEDITHLKNTVEIVSDIVTTLDGAITILHTIV